LHPVHRGVYAVGHAALPPLGREIAAVLACGSESAYLSHHSAASLWGLRFADERAGVHVTVTGPNCGAKQSPACTGSATFQAPTSPGIRACRSRSLRERSSISPELGARELERAFDEGLVRGLITLGSVAAMLERNPRRRGCARLRALADASRATTMTRSQAEELFLRLVRRARLEHPEVNASVGRFEVDFLWRPARLVVEVDGYAFDHSRRAFENDRRRDGELHHVGYQVMR
jgi:very-short-patch-repair endonuclease